MFIKLVVLASVLAITLAGYNGPLAGGVPAAQFPAGIDPKSCPNYPDCENPAVAVYQVPTEQYNVAPQYRGAEPHYSQTQYHQPQYQQPQYNAAPAPVQRQYSPEVQNALDRGAYIGDGDYHGEGLAEALAPGYQVPTYRTDVKPHQFPGAAPQLPAGVDARACPNYPYCS